MIIIAAFISLLLGLGEWFLLLLLIGFCIRFTECSFPAPPAAGGLDRGLVFDMRVSTEGSLPEAPPSAGGFDGELVFGVGGAACMLAFSLKLHCVFVSLSLHTFS